MVIMESVQFYDDKTASILLIAASFVLLASAAFSIYQFSVQYGLAEGIVLQSNYTKTAVAQILRPTVFQISAVRQIVLESFLLSGIGLAMFVAALFLVISGKERYEASVKRYVPLYIVLTLVYVVLLIISYSAFSIYGISIYLTAVALAISFITGIYLIYNVRRPESGIKTGNISINPSTPYSNIVALQHLFGDLVGEVEIVDRHFNSAAIGNLYRLLPSGVPNNIKALRVITSSERIDSSFGSDYLDFRREMKNNGVEVEIKIMDESDAVEQHERFIVDDVVAYKIPPLNIINKKSEHIVEMDSGEAKKRFDYLYRRATKFENYVVKQARG